MRARYVALRGVFGSQKVNRSVYEFGGMSTCLENGGEDDNPESVARRVFCERIVGEHETEGARRELFNFRGEFFGG